MTTPQKNIIEIKGAVVRDLRKRFTAPVDYILAPGEQHAVIGLNGSGKTMLTELIEGRLPVLEGRVEYNFNDGSTSAYNNISHITFRDAYGSADSGYYYQQRWNSSDREESPLVSDYIAILKNDAYGEELFGIFNIGPMLDKPIVTLSSGELRRFHVVKELLRRPQVMILENPFIGLDTKTRELLVNLLGELTAKTGLQLIIVVTSVRDIPNFVTHVYTVGDMRVGKKLTLAEFKGKESFTAATDSLRSSLLERPPVLPTLSGTPLEAGEIVRLKNINIRYGERVLFDGLDWTVKNGEKWSLTGANGSGKSTLLSLITADNPLAYALDITLFGRRRGTGESIWDIKKHIGYVSPEMHRSYLKDIPVADIVASGFYDSVGLYHTVTEEQREICNGWLGVFGIEKIAENSFMRVSSGEQRLALLARAFVKDPDLLILDEPLHGMDPLNKARALAAIERFCGREAKTLIYVTHYADEIPPSVTRRFEL